MDDAHKKRLRVVFKKSVAALMVEPPQDVLESLRMLDAPDPIRQTLLACYVDRCILCKIGLADKLLLEIIQLSNSWLTLNLLQRHFIKDEFSRKRVKKRQLELIGKGML